MIPDTRLHGRLLVLYACFFLSGVAGLVYEVVWSRYLALFVGSTGEAHIIILSTYMGGLALGAWLFGRVSDRVKSPLALYLFLELGIAMFGFLFARFYEPIRDVFIALARSMQLTPTGMHAASATAAVLSILGPTTLMGGTLPVLAKYLIRNDVAVGRQISSLYYLNSFGAVAGSLWAGFYLIRTIGLELSLYLAGTLNLAVAGLGYLLLKAGGVHSREDKEQEASSPTAVVAEGTDPVHAARIARVAMVVIGISGFVSMVYEVAWIRLLTLVLGSSSFSFAVMLAAFIFGIACGSLILSRKRTDGGYYRILGWCELGIGLTALVSIMFYEELPVVLNQWRHLLSRTPEAYSVYEFIKFVFCFLVMVVPTIFMGATLPAASRVVADSPGTLGRRIGTVFAINTVGTVLGAIIAGFKLLPGIGIKHTIELAVALNLLLGLWVLFTDAPVARRAILRPALGFALSIIVPVYYFVSSPSWDQRVFSAATYRISGRIESLDELKVRLSRREFPYYKDGTDATIAVARDPIPRGNGVNLALLINGKPDASTEGDMQTQLFIAHLPLLIHRDPQDVLVVGLGGGTTLGAASLHPLKSLECVELIPEVVEAARFFGDYNNNVLDNPNVKIIHQDAKTHLLVTDKKYDIIINEPTNPWIAGVAGLFSTEYFEVAKSRLKPGGLFLQWFQVYELEDPTLYSMLATLQKSFPYSTLFNFSSQDVAVIASTEPFSPDMARMEAILARPEIAADLKRYGVTGPLPLLNMQMVNKADTPAPYLRAGRINSDFLPKLEYEANRGFFVGTRADGIKTIDRRPYSPKRSRLWVADYTPSQPPPEALFAEYLGAFTTFGSLYKDALQAWVDCWGRYHPDSPRMKFSRVQLPRAQTEAKATVLGDASLASSPEGIIGRARLLHRQYRESRSFMRLPDSTEARAAIRRMIETNPSERFAGHVMLAEMDHDAWELESASANFSDAIRAANELRIPPDNPARLEAMLQLVELLADMGRIKEANDLLTETGEKAGAKADPIRYRALQALINQAEARRTTPSRGD